MGQHAAQYQVVELGAAQREVGRFYSAQFVETQQLFDGQLGDQVFAEGGVQEFVGAALLAVGLGIVDEQERTKDPVGLPECRGLGDLVRLRYQRRQIRVELVVGDVLAASAEHPDRRELQLFALAGRHQFLVPPTGLVLLGLTADESVENPSVQVGLGQCSDLEQRGAGLGQVDGEDEE